MSKVAEFPRAVATLLLGASLPAVAVAEGAVKVLACEVTQQCDADGQCEPRPQSREFHMEPISLNADGSGQFTLQYDGNAVPMQALSEAGPFVWNEGQHRHTLLASSETQFLLHTLSLTDKPSATIQFMTCSFRQ